MRPPAWTFDPDELEAAFNDRTKAIILCNPNNPTARSSAATTWSDRRALPQVGRRRDHRRDLRAHHLRRPPARRARVARGMRDRTVTISGMSKTYAVTGWRVGT